MNELFPPEFVAALSRLRLHAGQVPRGGRHAEQGSAQLGAGMEFRDYRSYQPGDDIRRIDWNFYQRSGRLFLRLFEEERDLPVYVLLDCSDSMFFEDPPRANAAKQAAAILIGAALNEHNRPALYPFGSSLNTDFPAISNHRALPATLERLAALGPAGPTDLPAVLRRLRSLRLRRGVVAVISDFFDPGGIAALSEHLHGLPHKLLLVRLARDADANPQLDGELLLEDCETGGDVRVTITPAALDSYQRAFADFESKLLEFTAQRRAGYIALDADGKVLEQFMDLFSGGLITTYG
jgi:uncharacterized protein (DUF58 family)